MDIEQVKQKLIDEREHRYERVLEYWSTRRPFENEDDIPDIPIVKQEDYERIIIPNIIRCGGIPKKDLIIGKTYIGSCRNSYVAKWTGTEFEYKRLKFGYEYIDSVNHFEDDDGYDVFVPIRIKNQKCKQQKQS